MKEKYKKYIDSVALITCAILIVIGFFVDRCISSHTPAIITEIKVTVDSIPRFFNQRPEDGIKDALEYYGVKHSDIVYKQALLETGRFTSGGCTKDNNLFGIMFNGKHAKFNHWSQSVVAYKDFVQYKYRDNEDYYDFLERIGYAADKEYINKLKKIK